MAKSAMKAMPVKGGGKSAMNSPFTPAMTKRTMSKRSGRGRSKR